MSETPDPAAPPTASAVPGAGSGRPGTARPLVTIVEPDSLAPAGRLGAWLEGAGARVRTVRLWSGDPVPALGELGGAMLLMGGVMSAHADSEHPWLPGVRALLRDAIDAGLPVLGVCLGAQVAAEALVGRTAVPSPEGSEEGVVELLLEDAAEEDPLLGPAVRAGLGATASLPEGTRGRGPASGTAAQDGGVTGKAHVGGEAPAAGPATVPATDAVVGPCPALAVGGPRLPVIVLHDDAVAALPATARLLASTAQVRVHAWRAGSLLALQHHPEADPDHVAFWAARGVARRLGLLDDPALAHGAPAAALPEPVRAAAGAARERAEAIEPVTTAFGRALAAAIVEAARGL